jgi:heme-degrading monooxygenase HmoA
MQYVRISIYRFKPGAADEAIRKTVTGLLPILKGQPGFVSYGVVKTGDDAAIALNIWDTRAQAEAAVQTLGTWVKDNLADLVESV